MYTIQKDRAEFDDIRHNCVPPNRQISFSMYGGRGRFLGTKHLPEDLPNGEMGKYGKTPIGIFWN